MARCRLAEPRTLAEAARRQPPGDGSVAEAVLREHSVLKLDDEELDDLLEIMQRMILAEAT